MEFGTYIISVDRTHSVWGQTWFENYPIRLTDKGIELLSVCDSDSICHSDRIDVDIDFGIDDIIIKQKIVECLPLYADPENVTMTKMKMDCGYRFGHTYRPLYISKYRDIHEFSPLKIVPSEQYVDLPIDDYGEYNNYIRQLSLLLSDLFDIFKTVEPTVDNLKVYGNSFRNIIILACTEVDALMKQISIDNGITRNNGRFSTKDYVRFKKTLQIDRYTVRFNYIDELDDITPFKGWDKDKSTETLSWYNTYNKIKHDRINNRNKATMKEAIDSIAGFAVVLMAEFGYRNPIWEDNIGKYIKIIKEPQWKIEDFYFPVCKGDVWKCVNNPEIV